MALPKYGDEGDSPTHFFYTFVVDKTGNHKNGKYRGKDPPSPIKTLQNIKCQISQIKTIEKFISRKYKKGVPMQKMQIHGGEKKVGADGRAFRHTWDTSHSFHMHSQF